jgi:DNA invertase Pin-like site-specific DNA recombinase
MRIGYARVSTTKQDLTRQVQWLESVMCERIFSEKISGTKTAIERPMIQELLSVLRPGDTLYVDEISRLGRNTQETIGTINAILNNKVEIVLNKENMTLSLNNPMGIAISSIFAVIAEMELIFKKERSARATKIAKERGRQVGRKPGYSQEALNKIKAAQQLYNDTNTSLSIDEMAQTLNISKPTFYNYLKAAGVTLYKDKVDGNVL